MRIRPSDLVSIYRLVVGSDLHVRLLDLCQVLNPRDVRLIELIMGGATLPEMAELLVESPASIEGHVKRLRRDVHQ